MQLLSPAFKSGSTIPTRFTCQGENINPELHISGVPKEARSLALIMDDPDAPEGNWVHWLMWNVSPETDKIMPNSVPTNSKLGITSFEREGYRGPCPPSGLHRYFFKLYALNQTLELNSGAKVTDLEQMMNGHIISSTELVGIYTKI